MSSLNKVILIGRLGKKPDTQHFDSGAIKTSFPLATTDYSKRGGERVEVTDWHNVVMWGRNAEVAQKYLEKGSLVCVEGRIKTRSWETENGKRYVTEILVSSFQMLSKKEKKVEAAMSAKSEFEEELPY